MTNLSDFLGNVVADISKSRANTDLQTIEIAKQYAKDNLLKHFAVPRFRIDTVELSIPIAINGFTLIKTKQFDEVSKEALYAKIYDLLKKSFILDKSKKSEIVEKSLSEFALNKVEEFVNNFNVENHEVEIKKFALVTSSGYINRIAEVHKELGIKSLPRTELIKQKAVLNDSLKSEVTKFIKTGLQFKDVKSMDVIVETAKLREVSPADKIMIKMKISEQGMEWIKMENEDGQAESKLIPE